MCAINIFGVRYAQLDIILISVSEAVLDTLANASPVGILHVVFNETFSAEFIFSIIKRKLRLGRMLNCAVISYPFTQFRLSSGFS